MAISIPNTAFLKRSLWSTLSLKDAIYGLCLAFMLMNQHFNNEERLSKLETANIQIAATLSKMSDRMDNEMVPRKENAATLSAIDVRLGNIEKGQSNLMTYLLNRK